MKSYWSVLRVVAALAILAATGISAFAAETAPVKIEIRHADKVDYDAGIRKVVLTGNVHIVRGTMSIQCDKVELVLTQDEKGIEQATAEGRVEIADGNRKGRADKAVFAEGSSEVIMTGSPRLWSAGNEIEADRIIYNLTTRSMQAEGKVRGFLLPGSRF